MFGLGCIGGGFSGRLGALSQRGIGQGERLILVE